MTPSPRYLSRKLDAALWRASAFARLETAARLRACLIKNGALRREIISMIRADIANARTRDQFARDCGWRLP